MENDDYSIFLGRPLEKPLLDRNLFSKRTKIIQLYEEDDVDSANLKRRQNHSLQYEEIGFLKYFEGVDRISKDEFTESEKKTYNKTVSKEMSEVIDLLQNDGFLNYHYGKPPMDFGTLNSFEKIDYAQIIYRSSKIYDVSKVLEENEYKIVLAMHNHRDEAIKDVQLARKLLEKEILDTKKLLKDKNKKNYGGLLGEFIKWKEEIAPGKAEQIES